MINRAVFENKEDWASFRGDLLTSSEISKILTEPKKKGELLSVGAKTYVMEKVTNKFAPPEPEYYNSSMEHGNITEPQAVLKVAKKYNKDLNGDDFIYTSTNGFVFFWDDEFDLGGTPDIIMDNMICEIKCPKSKTHLYYLVNVRSQEDAKKEIPEYYAQMQLNMYLTKKDKCLFVSFDDRFYDENMYYHEVLIEKDDEFIENLKAKAKIAKEYKESILKIINETKL